MAGESRNEASVATLREEIADASKRVKLFAQPRLGKKPAKARLEEWDALTADEVAALDNDEVDYYVGGQDFPAPEYLQRRIITQNAYTVYGDDGQPVRYYRVARDQVNPAGKNGLDIAGLPFVKFSAGTNPFFLYSDNAAANYGMGIARTRRDGHVLMLRSLRASPAQDFDDINPADRETRHWPAESAPYITAVKELPEALARSIGLRHQLPDSERVYPSVDAVFNACKTHPALFAARLPESAQRARPAAASAQPAKDDFALQEAHLAEALKAYGAVITAARRGNAALRHTLEMRNAMNSPMPPPQWKLAFPRAQDAMNYLVRGTDVPTAKGTLSGKVQRLTLYPFADKVALKMGITLGEVRATPFELRDTGLYRNSGLNLLLLEEKGETFAITVGSGDHDEFKKRRNNFGIVVSEDRQKMPVLLLTEDEKQAGKITTHLYSKSRIERATFQDLQADGFTVLADPERVVESVREAIAAEAAQAPLKKVEPTFDRRHSQGSKRGQARHELLKNREGELEKLFSVLAANRNNESYLSEANAGANMPPRLYVIVGAGQGRLLRKKVGEVNEEFKGVADRLEYENIHTAGQSRSATRREVYAITLTPDQHRALSTGKFTHQGKFSSDAEARVALTKRSEELARNLRAPKPKTDSQHIGLVSLLEAAAQNEKGAVTTVRLPDADAIRARTQALRDKLTPFGIWAENASTPPENPGIMEREIRLAAEMFSGPQPLTDVSSFMGQVSHQSTQVPARLHDQIAFYERMLRIVTVFGTELPLLMVRGYFKPDAWRKLQEAVKSPQITAEGQDDIANKHLKLGDPPELTAKATAVLDAHEVRLTSGKGKDRFGGVILLTPALMARIEEIHETTKKSARKVAGSNIPYGEADLALVRHFLPDTPEPEKPPGIQPMLEALWPHAVIVQQRDPLEDARSHSRPMLYITVTTNNRAEASHLLARLALEHEGIGYDPQATHTEAIKELYGLKEEYDFLASLRDWASDYDYIFSSAHFRGSRKLLADLRGGTMSEEGFFACDPVMKFLLDPTRSVNPHEISEKQWPVYHKVFTTPVRAALDTAGKEDVLSLLADISARVPVPAGDPRIEAFATLLQKLPTSIAGISNEENNLNTRLRALLSKQPAIKEALKDVETMRDLQHEMDKLSELKPPPSGAAGISFVVSDAESSRAVTLDDDSALARRQIDAVVKSGEEDAPVIIHYPLSPEFVEHYRLGNPPAGTFRELAVNAGLGHAANFQIHRGANALDGMIREDSKPSEESKIVEALRNFYRMAKTHSREL